jgi:hypothetical protein
MATETSEISPHLRGVTVTTISTLFGLIAGVASSFIASGPNDTFGLSILALAILAQLPVFQVFGIDVNDFSKKDHLYVAFMTFTLWFMTWGILLTAGSF